MKADLFVLWTRVVIPWVSSWNLRAARAIATTSSMVVAGLLLCEGLHDATAATVPAGFTETVIAAPAGGSWNQAVGIAFDATGRMFVWERVGRIWIKDPNDAAFSLLLDISEEVGVWQDHGLLGFALDPEFRVNGRIYLVYVVDRHHLLHFGTQAYNPSANEYDQATIGRLTRYTCRPSDGFRSVDPASRLVLIGATKQTGFPILSETHGIGGLLFAEDGTLLVSCGDGASPQGTDVGGAATGSLAPQGLADGIIRPKENIGAYRSQLLDCLSGKILRIDPATGQGIASNPFYDSANPASIRSRVWALGLRNPFRISLRPETGSHNPADGNPGVFYLGDVGYNDREELDVVTGPGHNFGWPVYEGLTLTPGYDIDVANLDAPNPLYPTAGCGQYFSFRDLFKEATLDPVGQPPFLNPCNSSQRIPASLPQFLHTRPVLDWNHASAITRTPTYGPAGQAQTANVGAVGSPVSGTQFRGNCAIGGIWYTGTGFPTQYQNSYFFADWGQGIMKRMSFDLSDKPLAVFDFASNAGAVVCLVHHPLDASLYYVSYTFGDAGTVRKLAYTGNRTPVAAASADKSFGTSPLSVQFSGSGSSDPDAQAITYSWNFGDGSPLSTLANPSHTFAAPAGVPTKFIVTLTVTDSGGLSAQATLIVSANNTPPNVTITSPVNGFLYPLTGATTVNLAATVSDSESSDNQLLYQWQMLLHHNDHNHVVLSDANHVATGVISPLGCDGINIYYYRIVLSVTDSAGLTTTRESGIFPDCGPNTPPTISDIPDQVTPVGVTAGPIGFGIGDIEVSAANLQLSATSSNPARVPLSGIVFGGNGANRTVTVTPAAGQSGPSTITVTVNDGPSSTSDSFVLTVTLGSAPTISNIGDQSTSAGTAVGPIGFTVADVDTAVTSLTVSGSSANTVLVPNGNIVFGGSGANRTATVTPAAGQTGTATITVTVSDGALTANDTFVLTVNAPISGGLAAAYGFNEGSGTAVVDASGNGNGGAIGAATWTTSGKYGSALLFNGTSARVTVNNSASLGFTTGMTLEAWVYPTALGGWRDVIYKGPNDIYYLMGSSATGSRPALGGSFATTEVFGTSSLTLNTWSHLSGTYDGATMRIYVNGVQVASRAQTGSIVTSTGVLTIGGDALYGQYFAGRIDEVRVYSRALSASEIQTDMNTPVGGSPPPNTTPTISDIADRAINEDANTGAIAFTIGDGETAAGTLTLSSSSSNPTLVPNGNIVFGGSGANRTVTVTPAANQSGTATITVSVSDGSLTANDTFVLTVNALNDAPTISDVANQSTTVNTATAAIPVTVGDVDTVVSSLTLSGSSSNAALVSPTGIVFGGSGANRTVAVTPAAGQTGSVTITVTVSDGALSAFDTFVLTVNAGNTAPTISDIVDRTISEDAVTAAIPFTIGDAESAAGSLAVSGASSNPALVPNGNIVFGGSGANRTVTVTTAANQSGTATITVTVSDGLLSVFDPFLLTVTAVNDAPTISNIADQSTSVATAVGPISFTVGDLETAATSLTVSGTSANAVLVPNGNIVFGGTGASRTVTVTPVANQSGTATITVTVSDGTLTANDTFVLTVNAPASGGLMAAYGFNEGSGTAVVDASGNGNGGAIGAATWTTAGKFGNALTFNGTGARVTVNDAASLDLTTGMTLEAWVYPTTLGGWRDVIYKGPNDIYYLMGSSANGSRPALGGTFATTEVFATTGLTLNTWSHLAGSYDGATMRMYVNGVQVASRAQTGLITASTGALTIGGDALYGQYWAGRIDEVRVYNRALSASEIQSDMAAPVGVPASPANAASAGRPPQIDLVALDDERGIRVTISGEVGFNYALEASSDLINWFKVGVQINATGSVVFSDQRAPHSTQFYRAVKISKGSLNAQ